jgi:N-acetylmuramoyl-L-alanine amidase
MIKVTNWGRARDSQQFWGLILEGWGCHDAGWKAMNAIKLWLLLLLCLPGGRVALAQRPAWEVRMLQGLEYANAREWAKASGFEFHAARGSSEFVVSNSWAKMTFNLESKKMVLNEKILWLSQNPLGHSNVEYLASMDLETLLTPILFPPKLAGGGKVGLVAIDAGHGGRDPGNHRRGHLEKVYTLLLAQELRDVLKARGISSVLVRTNDTYLGLAQRANIARAKRADLLVSLHYNAFSDPGIGGLEVFALTPAGALPTSGGTRLSPRSPGNRNDAFNAILAYQIQKQLTKATEMRDRGLRRAGFMVLRESTMPSVLVEAGFLTNLEDSKAITESAARRKVAVAIADGISAYKRLVDN